MGVLQDLTAFFLSCSNVQKPQSVLPFTSSFKTYGLLAGFGLLNGGMALLSPCTKERGIETSGAAIDLYITLLSVPGKVFSHVLLSRLEPLLARHRRPNQSGFTRGRSTLDAALAL